MAANSVDYEELQLVQGEGGIESGLGFRGEKLLHLYTLTKLRRLVVIFKWCLWRMRWI